MKCRWNLEVSDTKQIMGGFLELTQEMTEKQMIAYVRKIAREFMTNNKDINKYEIRAEKEGSDDNSFYIEARHNYKGGIDFMVYDVQKNEFILDTARDRFQKERQKYDEAMRKFEESLRSLQ